MLKDNIHQFFEKHPELTAQNRFAIAVSGGPDSMALTHALLTAYPDRQFHILSVDHGLRAEAAEETAMVGEWARDFPNATHKILKWEGDKPETSIMEEARRARYQLMAEYCAAHDIQGLFVGHHQDDQAETFLIRLIKGSGLDGLASMAGMSDYNVTLKILRPFLSVEKADILNYCDTYRIEYVQDPSNQNEDYLRPKIRGLGDLLEKEGLSNKRLATTAMRLSRARTALEFYEQAAFDGAVQEQDKSKIILAGAVLKDQPEEISLRLMIRAIDLLGLDKEYKTRLERVESLHEAMLIHIMKGETMKKRSLSGCLFSYNHKSGRVLIEKEHGEDA